MTKPAPETAAESTSTATAASSKPADAVQDLERRLQMLETTSSNNTTAVAKTVEVPAAKPAPSTTAAAGKNPLLVGGLFGKEKTTSSLYYSVCLTTCKQ